MIIKRILQIFAAVCVILLSDFSSAQEILPAVQQGHYNDVVNISVSPKQKIIVSYGRDEQLIVWDLNSGMQLKRKFIGNHEMNYFNLVNDNTVLCNSKSSGKIALNLEGNFSISSDTVETVKNGDGKVVLIGNDSCSINGPAITLIRAGKKITRTTQYFDKGFTNVVNHPESPYIYASALDGLIYVYSKSTFSQSHVLRGHQSAVNDLEMSPDGKTLYSASSDRTIIEWNLETQKLKRRFYGHSFRITALAFSKDGESLYFGNEIGDLKELPLSSYSQKLNTYSVSNHAITEIVPVNENELKIASLSNRVQSFFISEKRHNTFRKYHRVSWKQSQQKLYEDGFGMFMDPRFKRFLIDYSVSENSFVYTGNEVRNRNRIKIKYEQKKGRKRKTIRSGQAYVKALSMINDTCFVALRDPDLFSSQVATNTGQLEIWMKIKSKFYVNSTPLDSLLISDVTGFGGRYVACNVPGSVLIIDVYSGERKMYPVEGLRGNGKIWFDEGRLYLSDDSFTVYVCSLKNGHEPLLTGKLNGHDANISDLSVNRERNLIATASEDATIRFWSMDELVHKGTLIPVNKSDFILVAPNGDYQITKKAYRRFGFSGGLNFIFPDQFDLRFNKPHTVLAGLGIGQPDLHQLLQKAYTKRLKRMGFDEGGLLSQTDLPELYIQSYEEKQGKIELNLEANDRSFRLDRINVYVNEVPVFGSKGYTLNEEQTKNWKGHIALDLIRGKNKIDVSVLNANGVESVRKTVFAEYNTEIVPDLYVLCLGASVYKDARFNLSYASKDANDVASAFSALDNGVFSKVNRLVITDEQFTLESVEKCSAFLAGARTNDVVLLFAAGHGLLDKDLNYYLATYDIDFSNPAERGLPYETLESLLDGIAPLRKTVFIDACHSGEVDKEEVEQLSMNLSQEGEVRFRSAGAGVQKKNLGLKSTSELMGELFTDLRKGTGATVVSSAGGAEYAMESDQWKNGLFTYCLLRGLKDLKADSNKNGEILLSELQKYLRTEVVKISQGKQQPSSRIENTNLDFRIW